MLESLLSPSHRLNWQSLKTPAAIQDYLNHTPYSPEERNRCVVNVLEDRLAHCLDGGLFAAAALRRLGHPPLIIDLQPDPGMDDDHVLALYRSHGCWGALAKSNYVGLRMREPVYRTLRELVLSYFEFYFNFHGIKSLRSYTRPIDLTRYDRFGWETLDAGVDLIEQRLKKLKTIALISPDMAAGLSPVDELGYTAFSTGTNPEGVYVPGKPRGSVVARDPINGDW